MLPLPPWISSRRPSKVRECPDDDDDDGREGMEGEGQGDGTGTPTTMSGASARCRSSSTATGRLGRVQPAGWADGRDWSEGEGLPGA